MKYTVRKQYVSPVNPDDDWEGMRPRKFKSSIKVIQPCSHNIFSLNEEPEPQSQRKRKLLCPPPSDEYHYRPGLRKIIPHAELVRNKSMLSLPSQWGHYFGTGLRKPININDFLIHRNKFDYQKREEYYQKLEYLKRDEEKQSRRIFKNIMKEPRDRYLYDYMSNNSCLSRYLHESISKNENQPPDRYKVFQMSMKILGDKPKSFSLPRIY